MRHPLPSKLLSRVLFAWVLGFFCGCYCCLKTTTVGNDGVLKELLARVFSTEAAGLVCKSNSQIPGKKTEIDNKMGCQRLESER